MRHREEWDPPDREISLFVRESSAYKRLKAKGFCKLGIIPDFYGTIENINPTLWPNLDMFQNDELPPNAVVIEYIPDMQPLDLSNFSVMRMAKFRRILDSMHRAKVSHGDPYPRNMMIQVGDRERDTALSSTGEELISWEIDMMNYLAAALEEDYKQGKLKRAYSYYYEWFATLPS
ncbi:hypothetical protein PHISCL_06246 [Aspergillus sclerotialis]|uniref:Protein kinase domain-containing protein n=1 Tax=Aspergillus sclerotialis TaxID=2070753 RepID=A0A3A2ZTW5_9EURO|nr:hypothetical protein PHISCL_06246 [Aspergillus sclerotialis]